MATWRLGAKAGLLCDGYSFTKYICARVKGSGEYCEREREKTFLIYRRKIISTFLHAPRDSSCNDEWCQVWQERKTQRRLTRKSRVAVCLLWACDEWVMENKLFSFSSHLFLFLSFACALKPEIFFYNSHDDKPMTGPIGLTSRLCSLLVNVLSIYGKWLFLGFDYAKVESWLRWN